MKLRGHMENHVTTEQRRGTNRNGGPGGAKTFSAISRLSRCEFYSTMLRCAGCTWNALFRGSNGTIDRTPGIAAIYDDTTVNGSFSRAGRGRAARPNAG